MIQVTLESLEACKVSGDETLRVGDVAFAPAGTDDPQIGRVVAILKTPLEGMSWYHPMVILACSNGKELRYFEYPANKVEKGIQ